MIEYMEASFKDVAKYKIKWLINIVLKLYNNIKWLINIVLKLYNNYIELYDFSDDLF